MITLPNGVDHKKLLYSIKEMSWEISSLLLSYNKKVKTCLNINEELNIQNYSSGPVTDADLEISELIKNRLKTTFHGADWDFLSEEDCKSSQIKKIKSDWVWIIDPLDGTRDFIQSTGEYAMHLALTFKKIPILGIVLIPSMEELWIFVEGIGTWCEDKKENKKEIQRINQKEISQITIFTSKSHFHSKFNNLLEELNPARVIGMGSVGFKVASILRGEGDLYISYSLKEGSSPKDWDMAAPESLIRGVGGFFTDVKGKNLKFLKTGNFDQGGILIASMNRNHKSLCKRIDELITRKF